MVGPEFDRPESGLTKHAPSSGLDDTPLFRLRCLPRDRCSRSRRDPVDRAGPTQIGSAAKAAAWTNGKSSQLRALSAHFRAKFWRIELRAGNELPPESTSQRHTQPCSSPPPHSRRRGSSPGLELTERIPTLFAHPVFQDRYRSACPGDRNLAEIGPGVVEARPRLANIEPQLDECQVIQVGSSPGPVWSNVADVGPILADRGPKLAEFGLHRANMSWLNSANRS